MKTGLIALAAGLIGLSANAVTWLSDTYEVGSTETDPAPPAFSFAVSGDDTSVTVSLRAESAVADDRLEIFLSPGGTDSEYYRFAVGPSAADAAAWYYAEGGNIQPDPYGPAWSRDVQVADGTLIGEVCIPLSAFYMTRNENWRETWRVNVVRRREGRAAMRSWSPLQASLHEPEVFRTLGGFPLRAEVDDVCMSEVVAEMKGPQDGSVVGVLQLRVYAALAGDWELTSSYGTAAKSLSLKRGDNKAALACAYPDRGVFLTHFALQHKSSGRIVERDWPVRVDYQPVSVAFTRPQYRANFYPGQDASVVSGTLSLATGGSATVTLAGPGFTEQTATVADGGTFAFDTTGFEVGEATLTVTAGADTLTRKVRRLAPSAHRMTWVEDGHLVVDGTPIFRRNMYAKDYMIGARMKARYAAEGDAFPMTTEMSQVELSPSRLISGIEEAEAKRDVRPCPELFAKIDERIAANANTDFGCYYICDEPECRSISPVYLKYIYDYVAEKDPYHVIDMATRAGPRYLDCADVLEAHPYLNSYWSEGRRCYSRRPSELGSFIDAFEPEQHPEKCVGGLPTCFAGNGEYPTIDEYLLNCWVEIAHGAKTLWPYADHDIGDRAQLWEGTRYAFESARALTDLILFGARTMFVNEEALQGALFERGGDRLIVLCNCSSEEQTADLAELAGISGSFREFRGTRTFDLQSNNPNNLNNRTILTLQPLESLVLVTGSPDAGLSTLADLHVTVAAAEAERLGRDNQLLGRSSDIIVTHDLDGTRNSKLFDGCRDVLCKYRSWKSMNQLEMSFSGFVASFSKLRVFGMGLDSMAVKIRKGGEWVPLEPVAVRTEEWMRELDFGVTNETVKMRLEFPGPSGKKNDLELYEIELPRAGDAGGGGTVEPIPDAGVKALWDENDCPVTNVYSTKCWYEKGAFPPIQVTDTGFCVTGRYSKSANRYQASVSRYLEHAKQGKWAVIDIDRFVKIPGQPYYSWSAMFLNESSIAGGVTSPQAGIYAIRMPTFSTGEFFRMDIYGFDVYFNSIGFMDEPANRIELEVPEGEDDVRPGVRIAVEVHFAVPCADVSAQFLRFNAAGGYDAFKVNGSSGIDLRATDDSLTVWRAEIDVSSCGAANARSVYVKAVPLGGTQDRPVFGNFTVPFKDVPLADVVITSPGAHSFTAPNRYLMLSNAVANADVVFDRSSSAASASSALKFTGFDAVANAVTRFRGGWWDFMGLNGFFRGDSQNGGRLTEFSSGAVVTNAGPVEVGGTKGDGNAVVLKGASSLFADSLTFGRKSSEGQRSRVLVSDGSLLLVSGTVSFSEKGLWTPKGLTGNTLVVSNAGSRLVVGGTTYVGRQFTKAESGDKDGYDGTMGGNVLVITDGARASLRQLTIDNSCRHGVSNRLEVSRGAYLETTGLGLGSGWSSVVRDDHHRIDVFDGGVVSNRGAFVMGEYENSNHKYLTLAVSNGTFVATGKIDATKSLIQAAESEIRISGPNAVFQVGSYSSATPLFGSYAYGSRVIVENGACVELPIAYSYGYTHKTVRNAVIFRNGARYNGGNVGMAGYGSGGKACYSNSFVVASGSVVTTAIFRANCVAGRVTVEDATLVSTYNDAGKSYRAFWFGYPNDGTYSGGSNVVLEVKGRTPKVVAANGRIRFDCGSNLRIELPDTPYAAEALPLVSAKDTLVFDAATDCGVEILGADAFLRGLRRAHVRTACCELVRAKSIELSSAALESANRYLPENCVLAVETLVSGTQSLVLKADATSGCAIFLR